MAANTNFYMRAGNYTQEQNYDGNIFALNRGYTQNGTYLNERGGVLRNLAHSYTSNGKLNSSEGMISAGCFINNAQTLNYIQSYINTTWGIKYSYDIMMNIKEFDNKGR